MQRSLANIERRARQKIAAHWRTRFPHWSALDIQLLVFLLMSRRTLRYAWRMVTERGLRPNRSGDADDAYGLLTWIAGFAATQSGVLALAYKLLDQKTAVLWVYFPLSGVTVVAVFIVLWAAKPLPCQSRIHFFNQPTIYFAKWVLGCTVGVPVCVLIGLSQGYLEPERPTDITEKHKRLNFNQGLVIQNDKTKLAALLAPRQTSGELTQTAETLLDLLSKTGDPTQTYLFLAEFPFDGTYHDFEGKLVVADSQGAVLDALLSNTIAQAAFLVRQERSTTGVSHLSVRQQPFRERDGTLSNKLRVLRPTPGDVLIVVLSLPNQIDGTDGQSLQLVELTSLQPSL